MALYSYYTGQQILAGTLVKKWRILLEKNFYCPHALAEKN